MGFRRETAAVVLLLLLSLGIWWTLKQESARHPGVAAEVLRLQTEALPYPLTTPGGPAKTPITSLEIRGEIPRGSDGKGTVTLDESALTFNEFGDAVKAEAKTANPRRVLFRRVKPDSDKESRRLYEIEFADGSLAKRMHLVLSDGATGPHRLTFRAGDEPLRGGGEMALTHVLDLRGLPAVEDPLPDAPLGRAVNLETLSPSHGRPDGWLRRVAVRGTLGGPAHLDLDPNQLMLDAFGDVRGSTLIGYSPLRVTLEHRKTADPAKKGRTLYEVVPADKRLEARYSLVLSPTEAGPHRLLIREAGTLRQILPLHDPDRRYHMTMLRQLAATSVEERGAVADLRKGFGYHFRFEVEAGGITEVRISSSNDAERADPALKGLPNLKTLYFSGTPLGAAGLVNLRHLKRLETLHFGHVTIADAGLANLKDLPRLGNLAFNGCQGITDNGAAHLRGLKNLERLRLYREDFPKPGKQAAPRVTDAGLEHLKGLTNLVYLDLMGQAVTDAGLERLKGLSKLRELYLSGAGITDAGLTHLTGMARLKHLHLYDTRVTPKGEASLRANLPMLQFGH